MHASLAALTDVKHIEQILYLRVFALLTCCEIVMDVSYIRLQ